MMIEAKSGAGGRDEVSWWKGYCSSDGKMDRASKCRNGIEDDWGNWK